MTKIDDIKAAIAALTPDDVARLRDWFDGFDDRLFDAKIEADAASGKLDKLAEQALADHRAGRSRPL